MSKMYVYEESESFLKDCKFWSNSAGGLHHHGEYDLQEEELPDELQRVYRELFTEDTGSHCHLAEFRGEYGIALCNQYDTEFRKDLGLEKEEYWDAIKRKAAKLKAKVEDCSILAIWYGEEPYPEGEIIVFMPWYIQKKEFDRIANWLDKGIYRLDHPKIKLEDEEVLRVYDNLVDNSEIQNAIERNLDVVGSIGKKILADKENESLEFLDFYQRSSDLVKASIDATLIYLCGYDMKWIISEGKINNVGNK